MVSLRSGPLPGPAPAANTTASAPWIAAATSSSDGVLEVDDRGLGPGGLDVAGVVWIADQRDGLVPARVQHAREPQGDLAVASGDGYSHGVKPTRRPAPANVNCGWVRGGSRVVDNESVL